jgi:hypothetical protein
MFQEIIFTTRVFKDVFSKADQASLLKINLDFIRGVEISKRPAIFMPQIMRPKDGWCSDSLSFLFSYRVYNLIYMHLGDNLPAMEFEWQMISSASVEAFNGRNLVTLRTIYECPDVLHGAFIIPIENFICKLSGGQFDVQPGECFFVSKEDIVDTNLEIHGTKFITGVIWKEHPKNHPWYFPSGVI